MSARAATSAESLVAAKGDLLVGTANDTLERLAASGIDGKMLKTLASSTTGMEWGDAPATALTPTVTKTTAYTLTDSDQVVLADATSAAFTLTLPTAVGRSGRMFFLKKIDSTANVVTIDGNGSETLDGALTALLAVQYAALTLVSNGTGWSIL